MNQLYCIRCGGERVRGSKSGLCRACSSKDPEVRRKKSVSKIGRRNPQWKGTNVGLNSLHEWLKNRLVKPESCERCGKETTFLDLANKGKYVRSFKQWWFLCRRCHMVTDGRLQKLIDNDKGRVRRPPEKPCEACGKIFKTKWSKQKSCSPECALALKTAGSRRRWRNAETKTHNLPPL